MKLNKRIALIATAALVLSTTALPQIRQAIKIIGVGAAVQKFGPDMNKALNRLTKHTDTPARYTKVVPILTVGIGKSSAIGAAQVMGPKSLVDKVKAVAAPETELFGKEIRIRALIPTSNKTITDKFETVDGVGVSGIVDLKI
ncbi:MAG: hypothetical protein IT205_10550 [Fimbriimonadaceae bacterium]|jgi:hypothetical protein|nr:hypothetical protein [Fimbriimonadaceae bacterium]